MSVNTTNYIRIERALKKIENKDDYIRFLKFSKNFYKEDFKNQLLIFYQNPEARIIKTFVEWKLYGRIVIKNPHKIYIYKNPKKKNNKKIINGQVDVNGKEKKQRKEAGIEYIEDEKLRRVCTFDISDTMASRKLKKVLDIKKLVYLDNYDTKKLQKIVQDTCTIVRLSIIELQENDLLPKEHLPENHGNLDEFVYEIITTIYKYSFGFQYKNIGENFAESIAFLILDYFDLDTSFCKFNHVKDFNMLDIKTKLVIGCKMQNIVQTFIDFVKEEYNGQIMCA